MTEITNTEKLGDGAPGEETPTFGDKALLGPAPVPEETTMRMVALVSEVA